MSIGRTARAARTRAAVLLVGAAAIVSCALIAACDDSVSHIFAGRMYEPARGCVDTVTSMDVVEGNAPGAPCARACFVAPYADDAGSKAVYVSTMCAPFPPAFDATGTNASCPAALAAYDRNDTCLADGGTANPPSMPDAGAGD